MVCNTLMLCLLPDRSHSPPERARGVPRARARGDVSISPDRDAGRNRSPRPVAAPDRGSEVRSRQLRGERPIRDSGSVSPNFDRPIRDSGDVSPNPGRYSGGGGDNRVHANIQSPGDEWRTPGSRAGLGACCKRSPRLRWPRCAKDLCPRRS